MQRSIFTRVSFMKKNKAIVTLAVGKKYQEMFDRFCKKNWEKYCDTFSYDLIVEPIAKVEIKLNLPSPAHEARVCSEP